MKYHIHSLTLSPDLVLIQVELLQSTQSLQILHAADEVLLEAELDQGGVQLQPAETQRTTGEEG